MAGLQMDFDKEKKDGYVSLDKDGYKFLVEEELFEDNDRLEVKYSDNFLVRGFYVSNKFD